MHWSRTTLHFVLAALCVGLATTRPVAAQTGETPSPPAPPPICVDADGLALRGFDPVAYFELGEPRRGRPEFAAKWRGVQWRFMNDQHRRLFLENPNRYAPKYGGFCAHTMADGVFVPGNPLYWQIVDRHLYINCGANVHRAWQMQRLERIRAADKHWTRQIASHSR